MSESTYTVRPGDSLSKIARANGTTTDELAKINGITNIDIIRVGQHLKLREPKAAVSTPPEPSSSTDDDGGSSLWIRFVDALSQPIKNLKASVQAGGQLLEHITDAAGYLPQISAEKPGTKVEISVEKATGGKKKIAQFTSGTGNQHVLLTSPKASIASAQDVHEGPAKTAKPAAPKPPGTVTLTRSPAGNPVQQVALECPNTDNLKLGPNLKYRDIILAASKRSQLKPQAVAAIMNAEAATLRTVKLIPVVGKDGKAVIDKKTGKPKIRKLVQNTGEWDEKSASPLSSARGMTQFLDGSWIGEALTAGTYINDQIKKEGWLTTSTTENAKGKPTTVPAFKLATGKLVTAAKKKTLAGTLSKKPYLTGRATSSDANIQSMLDLRLQAEYAIHTAVDYGVQNMKALTDAGFKLDSLNDGEKAKIVYLCHHLGSGDAKKFINNTITAEHAQYLLENQVGKAGAAAKAKASGGDYLLAHRTWLKDFIDKRITLPDHMCDASKAETTRDLIPVTEAVRPAK